TRLPNVCETDQAPPGPRLAALAVQLKGHETGRAVPFPTANVQLNFGLGTASMQATDWAIDDYTNIVNSLGDLVPPIPPIPATVSFTVTWAATGPPTKLPNKSATTTGFSVTFRDSSAPGNAQVWWSATEPAGNFQYVSDPASTSTTISGVIGQERNGK